MSLTELPALTPPIATRLEMRKMLIVMRSLTCDLFGESGEEFCLEGGRSDVSAVTFSLRSFLAIQGVCMCVCARVCVQQIFKLLCEFLLFFVLSIF